MGFETTPNFPTQHPAHPLQELWLYSNQLTSVPRELAHLTALKRLWLDRNQLTSVPAELAQLTNLQVRLRTMEMGGPSSCGCLELAGVGA